MTVELTGLRRTGVLLALSGTALMLVVHWQVFFWVPTEVTMGVVQRIYYVHVPAAWVAFLAFGIVGMCSAVYLWLGDERLDAAAVSAAEGGLLFTTIVLLTGPLWARIAWGVWWEWDPRLTLTLLLWFIYVGYFMLRGATESPQRGKRFAAVLGILGVIDIPLIHLSVTWFRSLHPGPVVLRPEGPQADPSMVITLLTGFGAFLLLFFALMAYRYALERLTVERSTAFAGTPTPGVAGGGA